MELRDRFADFSTLVRENLDYVRTESDVCKSLINPFLERVEWQPALASRVIREYKIPNSNDRADYALLSPPPESGKLGNPLIIIEAKHKDASPTDHLPPDQLRRYVHMLPTCKIGAWTNGTTWLWFCQDFTHTLNEKPFLQFNVTEDDWLSDFVLEWLRLLRDQFSTPKESDLLSISRRQDLKMQTRDWWNLNKTEPTPKLLKLIWGQLKTNKRVPSVNDLRDLSWAWAAVHDDPSSSETNITPSGNDTQRGASSGTIKEDDKPTVGGNGIGPPIVNGTDEDSTDRKLPLPPKQLNVGGGRVLSYEAKPRAWCYRDPSTGQWSEWRVSTFGIGVQTEVTEWLISWNSGGVEPLIQGSKMKQLAPIDESFPKGRWTKTVGGGKARMYTNLSNPAREKWLIQLARRVRNDEGKTPQHGKDFLVWLPGGAKKG